MTKWTQQDFDEDVCHDGRRYIRIDPFGLARLQRGVWFRDGDIMDKHSVCGLFSSRGEANAAGQVLLQHSLPTRNDLDLKDIAFKERTMAKLTLPAKFGAAGLLVHNNIPVYGSLEEAAAVIAPENPLAPVLEP